MNAIHIAIAIPLYDSDKYLTECLDERLGMPTNNTKQAAWVALGSLFAVGFAMVSAMILSRYFSKGEYGLYKQVMYVYMTLYGFFTLGLPKAFSFFLPISPLDQAKSLIKKLTNIFFILGGALALVIFFGADFIANALNAKDLAPLLRLFSIVPVLMMPTLGLEGILATYRMTKLITVYVVTTRFAMLVCTCAPVVFFHAGVRGAIIGFVASSFISFLIAYYLKFYPVRHEQNNPTTKSIKEIFSFCLPLFIASIWGILINSTDQFFISRYFGNEVFADFSNGSMELPFVGIIISATTTVLTPLFTKMTHNQTEATETILPLWNNAFIKSALLIYPITVFCIFEANDIMTAMYGEQYIMSGSYFRIKLFTYFFKIIAFYSIIVALDGVKFYQRTFFFTFIGLVLLEILAVKLTDNSLIITAVHVFCSISVCFCFFFYIAKKLNVSFLSLIPTKTIAKVLLCSLIASVISVFFMHVWFNGANVILRLCLSACIFAVCFFAICVPFKLNYINIIKPLLKK